METPKIHAWSEAMNEPFLGYWLFSSSLLHMKFSLLHRALGTIYAGCSQPWGRDGIHAQDEERELSSLLKTRLFPPVASLLEARRS